MMMFPNHYVVKQPDGLLALWSVAHSNFMLIDCDRREIIDYMLSLLEGEIDAWIFDSVANSRETYPGLCALRNEIERRDQALEKVQDEAIKALIQRHQKALDLLAKDDQREEELQEALADLGEKMEP